MIPATWDYHFFNRLRNCLELLPSTGEKKDIKNYLFFEEVLVYWEMLLSFMADGDTLVLREQEISWQQNPMVLDQRPHPWTGIARLTLTALHEVEQVIRHERKRARNRPSFILQADIDRASDAINQARQLEERLLNLSYPSEAEIMSP